MRENRKGFFLFSFSVYLSCIFLLCALLFSVLYISYKHIFLLLHHNTHLQNIEKAQWHIIRLLQDAPHAHEDFINTEEHRVTWRKDDYELSLFCDIQQKKLYFIKLSYNNNTQQKSTYEKNLILEGNVVQFSYQKDPLFITCTIKNEKYTVMFMIQPRMGVHFLQEQGTV